jgi:glycosyltransferase involved in cell wall biosynthesis
MHPPESAKPRLLFCSYHSYLDPASGAALSTRDLLELLAANGWDCAALCGPEFDTALGAEDALRAEGVRFQYRPGDVAGVPCTLYHGVLHGVPAHAFAPAAHRPGRPPSDAEGRAFLELFETARARFRPDVLLTFGGHGFAVPMMRRARQNGAKVVFALHNFAYSPGPLFSEVDAVLVPSEASRRHYARLGIESTAIPGPFNWDRVLCPECPGRHVLFVNPTPAKGVRWFARIASEVARVRPQTPFLVVEGRGGGGWLARCGADMAGADVRVMSPTADPRAFYREARVVLVPSLVQEAFGRVAAEAMMNGLPVLASRRGGLPEAMGGAGFLFDVPERYTPEADLTPTAEEVAPWVETLVRLCDDGAFYRRESERCRAAAERWQAERLLPVFNQFLRSVIEGGSEATTSR